MQDGFERGDCQSMLLDAFARLAMISGLVQKRLYSIVDIIKNETELLDNIGELDDQLTSWRDSLPQGMKPESTIESSDPSIYLVEQHKIQLTIDFSTDAFCILQSSYLHSQNLCTLRELGG